MNPEGRVQQNLWRIRRLCFGRRLYRTTCDAARARRFAADARASVGIIAAVAVPMLVLTVGGAIDFASVVSQKNRLQAAADAAAVAAARELTLSNVEHAQVLPTAYSYLKSNLADGVGVSADFEIETTVHKEPTRVELVATQKTMTYFGDVFGLDVDTVRVRSVARVVGTTRICVIGLATSGGGVVSLDFDARLTGENCAVFSNSKSSRGLKSKSNALLRAALTCSAGGSVGGPENFDPEPLTDCPVVDDPLSDRPEPSITACDHKDVVVLDEMKTLFPGVYCGGLRVSGNADVVLEPGVYTFSDGPLKVEDTARLSGDYVGLYLAGKHATFHFGPNTTISLSAPKKGDMAGLLVFESRKGTNNPKHEIRSNDARVLLGTIYLPRGELTVDADRPVADQSAYTAIVAQGLHLYAGPHLVLNTNYHETDVPVPRKIRGSGNQVVLDQ